MPEVPQINRPRSLNELIVLALASAVGVLLSLLVLVSPEHYQPELTAPLILASIILAIVWCLPSTHNKPGGKIDYFHPSMLWIIVFLAYIILPGIWLWLSHDYQSMWIPFGSEPAFTVNSIFAISIVSTISFGLGIRTRHTLVTRGGPNHSFSKKKLFLLVILFLGAGGFFKYLHLASFGPLTSGLLLYLSPSARSGLGISVSQFNILFESMLDWAVLLIVFYFIIQFKDTGSKKGWWLIPLIIVAVAAIDYLISGKRSAFIPFFLFPLIWYHYLIRRLTLFRAGLLFLGGMAVIVGSLLARIVLPLAVQNLKPSDYLGSTPSEIIAFYMDTPELATFDLTAASILYRDDLLDQIDGPFYGFLKYSFGTLTIFIPRMIWPDKPSYEDLGHVYYRTLIGGTGTAGFAPTLWGSSLLFFDLPGLVISMYILGWIFKIVYVKLNPIAGSPPHVLLYSIFLWMAFHFIRFGTTGFVLILFIQSMIPGIAALFIWRKRQSASSNF